MQPEPISRYRNQQDLQAGLEWLAARDTELAAAYQTYGVPDLRKKQDGFAGLVRLLISQQVSTAAAAAIQARFEAHLPKCQPQDLLASPPEALAACGISRPKQRYLRLLAEALVAGDLKPNALRRAPDQQVYEQLTALTGIGPWTAQCYLLFSLCRSDVFPAGDLALQEAYKMLYRQNQRPSAALLEALAARWQPHRGAAARLLWAYYNGEKGLG